MKINKDSENFKLFIQWFMIILTIIFGILFGVFYMIIDLLNLKNDIGVVLGLLCATSVILFILCFEGLVSKKKDKKENDNNESN